MIFDMSAPVPVRVVPGHPFKTATLRPERAGIATRVVDGGDRGGIHAHAAEEDRAEGAVVLDCKGGLPDVSEAAEHGWSAPPSQQKKDVQFIRPFWHTYEP